MQASMHLGGSVGLCLGLFLHTEPVNLAMNFESGDGVSATSPDSGVKGSPNSGGSNINSNAFTGNNLPITRDEKDQLDNITNDLKKINW